MRLNDTDLLMLKDKLQLLASLLEHKAEKAAREPLGTPIRSK
jgi:hypothetical protein